MIVIEKTATTTLQKTPYLEYRNVIVENLGSVEVQIMTAYLDLRKKMIDEGAVMDKLEPYGMLVYEELKPRVKTSWFGLRKREVYEIGFVEFKTASGSSDIRLTAFNGHVGKVSGGASIRPQWYDRNPSTDKGAYALLGSPHALTLRKTYTCPAGKKAMVEVLQCKVIRYTAPTTARLADAYWSFNDTIILIVRMVGANVNDKDSAPIGTTLVMLAGDTLKGYTQDTSTGGLCYFFLSYKVTEFDA